MLLGQSKAALEATESMEATITDEMLQMKSPPMANWMEFFKAVQVHVLIRFGMWEEPKDLKVPEDEDLYCVTRTMTYYGKAIAYASTGNIKEAEKHRSLYHENAKLVPSHATRFSQPHCRCSEGGYTNVRRRVGVSAWEL